MKYSASELGTALAVAALAALGGALAVYSGFDDAPGGVLIGLILVLSAVALALRAAGMRR